MIDTHAHINDRFCDVSLEETVGGIKKSDLRCVILAASNIEESKNNVEMAKSNKGLLWASVGIHPQDTAPELDLPIEEQIISLEELANLNREYVVAIGETGLDYSPPPPEERERDKDEQEILFRKQIQLAKKYSFPLIIHARKSVDEVLGILGEYKGLRGVFHCYTGGKKRIKNVLDLGVDWYFGIDGNLTYETGLADVVAAIPKEKLILETDSPFLTPIPHRGEVNKPEYVKYIYGKVASIWMLNLEETESIVDDNALRLFGLNI